MKWENLPKESKSTEKSFIHHSGLETATAILLHPDWLMDVGPGAVFSPAEGGITYSPVKLQTPPPPLCPKPL